MKIERLTKAFLENQPKTPLSMEESMLLMQILIGNNPIFSKTVEEIDKKFEFYKEFEPILKSFEVELFLRRLKLLTTHKITIGALLFILQFTKNPAHIVMYLYYINSKLSPNTIIDINTISMNLFPFGVFSDEQLNNIWNAQKVQPYDGLDECTCHGAPDNLLDYNEIWR